jgi:hypothetical protein
MPRASERGLWFLLLLAPLAYGADVMERPARAADTAPEFIDFLEYLGSWEGEEQDWIQFLEEEQDAPRPDAAEKEADVEEDKDDVVS